MAIQKYKPTSPGRRDGTVVRDPDISGGKPEKSLLEKLKRHAGRNVYGRITSHRRGGGHKRKYRRIDFRRRHDGVPANVAEVQYDPNRTANVALLHYADGKKTYIVAPLGLRKGDTVMSGPKAEPKVGCAMTLAQMPLGTTMHCVELRPGQGAVMGRSAGSSIRLLSREGDYAQLILPSGEQRRVHVNCRATIGQVGNIDHGLVKLGKAGRNRWRGRRPKVRGTAMSAYAHPMGGGEGRTAGGRHPVSPWGKLAKGGKTRNPRKTSSRMIIRRRKKKR
ncbi:MAG: large subunit ribosomal protein L2 [Pseudohongiellaceae bacterium]|jgi:large subunit ribosomal protein L2